MNEDFNIRPASVNDAKAINDIANWYIENTSINFDIKIWPLEKRIEWINTLFKPGSPYKLLTGVSNKVVIGFACNTRFRPKAAYDSSTETTVYISNQEQSKGRGGMLYRALLDLLSQEDFHRAYAVITQPNTASNILHERLGFELVGNFTEIGKKFNTYHDISIYQKAL